MYQEVTIIKRLHYVHVHACIPTPRNKPSHQMYNTEMATLEMHVHVQRITQNQHAYLHKQMCKQHNTLGVMYMCTCVPLPHSGYTIIISL